MSTPQSNLCPCGSGLRPLRCCSLDPAAFGPAGASRHLLPLVDRAIEIHAKGAFAEAEKLCLEVLELAPGQGGALAILYQIRKVTGPHSAAEALVRRMVLFNPNNVWATQELALLLFGKGDFADAELHARNAVRIAPSDPQSHNLMA
jgi:Flp pilus assembly protein TadD